MSKKPEKSRQLFHMKMSGELYPRPVVETFHYLKRKYPKCHWGKMSLRKQVCLLYLQWMVFPNEKEHRTLLIDKVKEWRKKEPNRVGGKRSVLEKLARKFYQAERREKAKEKSRKVSSKNAKKTIRNKTNLFTPENQAWIKTREAIEKRCAAQKGHLGHHWWVFSPDGEVFEVHSLRAFCRERGLNDAHLGRTAKYPGWSHKGWTARKRNIDLEGYTPGYVPYNKRG